MPDSPTTPELCAICERELVSRFIAYCSSKECRGIGGETCLLLGYSRVSAQLADAQRELAGYQAAHVTLQDDLRNAFVRVCKLETALREARTRLDPRMRGSSDVASLIDSILPPEPAAGPRKDVP